MLPDEHETKNPAPANGRPQDKAPKSEKETRAVKVRIALEKDIFTGILKPGSRVDEAEIATRFGISRTPVREAILQLVQSGLIEKEPRQGAVVARLDIRSMIQMFEVLSELEGYCARLATRRMSAEEKQQLEDAHALSAQTLAANDMDGYFDASRKFHRLIFWGSRNQVLVCMMDKLALQLLPYRRYQLNYPGRAEENFRDHQAILDAIRSGDADLAYRLLREHTAIQGDIFAEYIALI